MAEGTATATLAINVESAEVAEAARRFAELEAAAAGLDRTMQRGARSAQKLAQNADKVRSSADGAADKVRAFGAATERSSGQANFAASAVGKLVGAFLTMEVAKRVVTGFFRTASALLQTYIADNAGAASQVEMLRREFEALRSNLAEAAFGAGNFEQAIELATDAISTLNRIVAETAPALNGLVGDVVDDLSDVTDDADAAAIAIGKIGTAARVTYNILASLAEVSRGILDIANPLDAIAAAFDNMNRVMSGGMGLGEFAAETINDALAVDRFAEAVDSAQKAIVALNGTPLDIDTNIPERASRALWDMVDSAVAWGTEIAATERPTRGSAASLEAEAAAALAAAQSIDAYLKRKREQVAGDARSEAAAASEAALAMEQDLLAKRKDLSERAAALALEAEQTRLTQLAELQAKMKEADAERQRESLQDAERWASGMGNAIGSVAKSFGEMAISGDTKAFGQAIATMLGDILVDMGMAAIAMGAINLIPPPWNPMGNPAIGGAQLAAGFAAVATGSALSAAGGGGAGGGAGAPTASLAPATQTTNYYQSSTSSVGGVIGDRQAMRALRRLDSDAKRHGVR